jgi:hypothetical protein
MIKYDFIIRTKSQETETVRLLKQPEEGLPIINPNITIATYKNGQGVHYDSILIEAFNVLRLKKIAVCSANIVKTGFECIYSFADTAGNNTRAVLEVTAEPNQQQANIVVKDIDLALDLNCFLEFVIKPGQWLDISFFAE